MDAEIPLTIVAWNPNGIRALCNKSSNEVKRLIKETNPDVLIFNEIKGNKTPHIAKEIEVCVTKVMPGYTWIWNHSSKKNGQHGLCIGVKSSIQVKDVFFNFHGYEDPYEPEGRIITVLLEKCVIVGIYAVNAGQTVIDKIDKKLEWMAKLMLHCEKMKEFYPTLPIIIMGDWNIAPQAIDIHNPTKNDGSAGYTKQERDCYAWFLSRGWIDVFRHKNPDAVKYTYWNNVTKARSRGSGWRIDHCVVNKEVEEKLIFSTCEILEDYMGSDHCPILFRIDL